MSITVRGTMKTNSLLHPLAVCCGLILVSAGRTHAAKPEQDGAAFFEKKIRPVLIEHCYRCHSAEAANVKAGLFLDTRSGLRNGGDSGEIVVPTKPNKSLLIASLRGDGDASQMPPNKKLPEKVIQDFERWVKMGAPDPRPEDPVATDNQPGWNQDQARTWWAFQPVKAPQIPTVQNEAWARSPIDQFVLARLDEKNLKPVSDASRETLIRRLSFDLTGLPPSRHEIEAFAKDSSPNAIEKVVDRLLDSPQFGETWGRHWLDLARYAESGGRERNTAFPHAWRYRDYVIQSVNDDVPYDQFLIEQIAGDLLPAANDNQRARQLIATGFLAIGPKPITIRQPMQFRLDVADEQLDTLSQAMLGLTIACARCHDHKFDPVTQKDYYSLAGILTSSETLFGGITSLAVRQASPLIELPAGADVPGPASVSPRELAALHRKLEFAKRTYAKLSEGMTPAQRRQDPVAARRAVVARDAVEGLEQYLALFDETGSSKKLAMGMRDRSVASNLPVYARGELSKPGTPTPRGLIGFLGGDQFPINPSESGRLQLAMWVASKDNPLTARVMVNRIWGHLLGAGIVGTPDNFGAMGELPTHPELLDYLAVRFVDQNWSLKKMVREIVLSRTYQLSTEFSEAQNAVDPDNKWLWRKNQRRLRAEEIRDALLANSGMLELSPPEKSPVAALADGIVSASYSGDQIRSRTPGVGTTEPTPAFRVADVHYRSVYLPVLRDLVVEPLAEFDFAEASLVVGQRDETNVPSQALFMMNSPLVLKFADGMAGRLIQEFPQEVEPRIDLAFQLALGRNPTEAEKAASLKFVKQFQQLEGDRAGRDKWTAFCQSLFGTAEFRYLQ